MPRECKEMGKIVELDKLVMIVLKELYTKRRKTFINNFYGRPRQIIIFETPALVAFSGAIVGTISVLAN